MQLLLLKASFLPLFQNVLGGGAGSGEGATQAEGGPVQEDGGGGRRRPDGPGAFPTGCHQAPLHAVEGEHELHQHPGLQDRRNQGGVTWTLFIISNTYSVENNLKSTDTEAFIQRRVNILPR